jgi:hypothetical protein
MHGMHALLLVATLLTGPLQPSAPATALAAANEPDVNGVWEGRRSRARLGACTGVGPGPTTLTLWTEADGAIHGQFTKVRRAAGEPDLKGKLEGRKVVFEAPRLANCNGSTRRYSVTLEGSFAADSDGKRRLTLTGVDQTCPLEACTFRDEYTLTWMRPAPAPAVR